MSDTNCPDRERLVSLHLGTLPEDAADPVLEHVSTCLLCQATLDTIGEAGDLLVGCLQHAAKTPEHVNEPECLAALARAESLVGKLPSEKNSPVGEVREEESLGELREYRLLEKLGKGGMGAVYRALHTKLDKVVALKVLSADRMQNRESVVRFEREMKAVGKLNHPNIVGATDAGEVDGTHYLVMELVDGVDLSTLVRRVGRLDVPDACEIVRQAAAGLQHSHRHGMVHRDIKPSNLMLASNDLPSAVGLEVASDESEAEDRPSAIVKILDMGLALLASQYSPTERELTTTGQLMGTLDYMAPEQGMDSHEVDIRADIYSLGATLFKLLCGQAPFSSHQYNTPVKMMRALATQQVPSIATKRDDLPPDLVAVVDRMLAKEPDDRYSTPTEVIQALEPFAGGCELAALLERATSHSGTKERGGAAFIPAGGTDHSVEAKPDESDMATDAHLTSPSADTAPTLDSEPAKPEPATADSAPTAVPCQPVHDTGEEEPTPAISPSQRLRSIIPNHRTIAIATALGAIVLLGIILTIATKDGTVVVEGPDGGKLPDDVIVQLREGGDVVEVSSAKNWTLRVKPGEYQVDVRGGNDVFRFANDRIAVSRFGRTVLSITRKPIQVATPAKDQPEPAGSGSEKSDAGVRVSDASEPTRVPATGEFGFIASSYLGGSGFDDAVVGAKIQSDGTIVLAANLAEEMIRRLSTSDEPIPAGKRGCVLRLGPEGQQILTLEPVARQVSDLALDGEDNIYVAAHDDGLRKLTQQADSTVWHNDFSGCTRVDATGDGHVAAIAGGNVYVFDSAGSEISATKGSRATWSDVCIDGVSQTVVFSGYRSARVVMCYVDAIAYDGQQKWRAYGWSPDPTSEYYVGRDNMTNTKACRCAIGRDGKLYVAFEVSGGNHCLRYDPFDVTKRVQAVGGDSHHYFHHSGGATKCFFGRYEPSTGKLLLGQEFCPRLADGRDNTVKVADGDIAADNEGRVYLVGHSNHGLPVTFNTLGQYVSGGFILIMSPDFKTRVFCTRTAEKVGFSHAVDARTVDGKLRVVYGGSDMPQGMFVHKALQEQPGDEGQSEDEPRDGFFAVVEGQPTRKPQRAPFEVEDASQTWERGQPLSDMALVSSPPALPGAKSWTVETIGHRGAVRSMAYHPDGEWLATACDDGVIRLWETKTGKLVKALLGHAEAVNSITWAPDGSQLASAGDTTIRLWDVESGQTVRTLRGDPEGVASVDWSPDGQRLAFAGRSGVITLWNVPSATPARNLCRESDDALSVVAWSPDGKALASGKARGGLDLWDASSGKLLREVDLPKGDWPNRVRSMVWSPDGRRIAVTVGNARIFICRADTGEFATWGSGTQLGWRAVWSTDGKTLIAARDKESKFTLWDVECGEVVGEGENPVGQMQLTAMASSSNAGEFALARLDGTVATFDMQTCRPLLTLPAYRGRAQTVEFSRDGKRLAVGSANGTAQLWELDSGEPIAEFTAEMPVVCTSLSPDGTSLLTGHHKGGTTFLLFHWDIASGRSVRNLSVNCLEQVAWSLDGKTVAVAGDALNLMDSASGELQTIEDVERCGGAAWSPDGRSLACSLSFGGIKILDVESLRIVKEFREQKYSDGGNALAWTGDGRLAFRKFKREGVLVVNVDTGEQQFVSEAQGPIETLCWMPDGKTLLGGSRSQVAVWDTEVAWKDKVVRSFPYDGGDFWPDDGLIASRGESTIRLRSLEDGRVLRTLLSLRDERYAVIAPDGQYHGSTGIEKEFICVVQTESGQQVTLPPGQFAERYHRESGSPESVNRGKD